MIVDQLFQLKLQNQEMETCKKMRKDPRPVQVVADIEILRERSAERRMCWRRNVFDQVWNAHVSMILCRTLP